MAGNTQMREEERGVFSFHGAIGGLLFVAILLSILVFLEIWALEVQQNSANKPYEIKNIQNVQAISDDNYKYDISNN
ncbi:MAG TPA: DUF4006 family protein [Campylobacterales bacterium]|nr:DUF4006 family protein [Campylobacterales bacterium]HIO70602.1 DUF4006 family protein [Campylobacterales bacterium]